MAGGVHSPVGPAGAMGRGCEIRSPLPAAIPPPGRIWHWQALARKLAVILHRIWLDGSEFRWSAKEQAA